MSGWIFTPISLQYLITSAIAALILLFVHRRQAPSPAKTSITLLGITIMVWQLANFLHRTAPSAELSELFLRLAGNSFILVSSLILLCLLNIYRPNVLNWLALALSIPPMTLTMAFTEWEIHMSRMYGWSYTLRFTVPFHIEVLIGMTHMIPIAASVMVIAKILRGQRDLPIATALKRKLTYLLLAMIVSQAIGIPVTNILIQSQPNLPPIGGFIQLLSLFFLWMAIYTKAGMPVRELALPSRADLASAYTYFLRKLQEKAIPRIEMGERSIQFYRLIDFLGLGNAVNYDGAGLIVNGDLLKSKDPIALLDRLLSFIETNGSFEPYACYALGVINTTGLNSLRSSDTEDRFNTVIKMHLDLLDRTDLISGISYGRLGGLVYTGFHEREGWRELLRLYKRAMLRALNTVGMDVAREVIKAVKGKASGMGIELGPFGDVGMLEFEDMVAKSKGDREGLVIDALSSLLMEMFKAASLSSKEAGRGFLRAMRTVFTDRSSPLARRAFESMALRLLDAFPYGDIAGFLVDEASMVSGFSSKLGMKHEGLMGKAILLEFRPRDGYEAVVGEFVKESVSHGERCVLFTRKGSRVRDEAIGLGAEVIDLVYAGKSGERSVVLTDRVQILDAMNRSIGPLTSLIFDSLSDMILASGEREAYMLTIQALELVGRSAAPSLFLMNGEAHERRILSAFEALFSIVVSTKGEGMERVV